MLNIEELLIKIMKILDFDMNDIKLKQTLEKRRFYTNEESDEKYKEHINIILEKLNLGENNSKLSNIFIDLINLYIPIYNKVNLIKFIASEKKINWIILKRLVIPYLAKRLSSLDSDYSSRVDKGLSGGLFWYLPDVTDYPNIKMPMEYIMNWWLDLYGKGIDSLCDELDDNNKNVEKPIESKNTIKQWFKKSIPDRQSIEEYFSIPIVYNGCFEANLNDTLNIQFKKACTFIIEKKKLSIEKLKYEIPSNSLVDRIFNSEPISQIEKKEFVSFIAERWEIPTKEKLIRIFIIARSSESVYKSLLSYFSVKDLSDIEDNKLLQLTYLYCHMYNENLQRYSHGVHKYDKSDILKINYEYLDSLTNNFNGIVETISNDINIELSNQNYTRDYLEDIYQIKFIVFMQNKDKRIELVAKQLKDHHQYFHEKFDKIEFEVAKYFPLSYKDKMEFINNINDIQCLINIYDRELTINDELAEKCVFKMQVLSKTPYEALIVLFYFIKIYTILFVEYNIFKLKEASTLILKYENSIKGIKEKEIELLRIKIHFYVKSKQFNNALKASDEYFIKYFKFQKKDIDDIEILFLGAYSAYIENNKSTLKQYNKYLKKYTNSTFINSKSLPFKIFFYKKL